MIMVSICNEEEGQVQSSKYSWRINDISSLYTDALALSLFSFKTAILIGCDRDQSYEQA